MSDEQLKKGVALITRWILEVEGIRQDDDDGGYSMCPACWGVDGSHEKGCAWAAVRAWWREVKGMSDD